MYQANNGLQYGQSEARLAASRLYGRVSWRGWWRRVWSKLRGRPHRLLALDEVKVPGAIRRHRYVGTREVLIDQIRGSENRCEDFDADFYPLHDHNAGRWIGIAAARLRGVPLPPVALIQVGEVYYVRDGHHRVSVARAMGNHFIDAVVTAWDVHRMPKRDHVMTHVPEAVLA